MSARVALVHDWLVGWGGSERVLQELAALFPEAPIHTAVWAPDEKVRAAFGGREIRTSPLGRVPGIGRRYRSLLPLMPRAFRAFDLTGFDLVVSSSHSFSKAVRASPEATHLCYCHTPPRYLWDLYREYSPGWKGVVRAPVARALRRADLRAARGVTRFLANSRTVADRIQRHYDAPARVVHPPVDVERFLDARDTVPREEWFLAGGRFVSYKRLDLAIRAAAAAGVELRIFGDGPDRRRLERLAGDGVRFLGHVPEPELPRLLAGARAFLFPGEEDFGILPVEAMAAGTPVLAFGRGGATETVGTVPPGGVLIDSQEVEEWAGALRGAPEGPPPGRGALLGFRPEVFREGIAAALEPKSDRNRLRGVA